MASSSTGAVTSTASGTSSGSSVFSECSTTISDQWKDPSTWYAPNFNGHTTKLTSTGATKHSYTAGHYSHPETSSAVTSEASSSCKIFVIPASPSSTSSKDIVTVTSQLSIYTSSVPASVPKITAPTTNSSSVLSSPLQGRAHPSSSLVVSPQPTSPATSTTSGAVTQSLKVSWLCTSTPKLSSDDSAGQRLVFSPSLGMAVLIASSFILPFVAW